MNTKIVVILGMHRSGTSCLAGALQKAGLHLGAVLETNQHNAKGNRENKQISQLNEKVLMTSGGSWKNPPNKITWQTFERLERDAILKSYADIPCWGFKDPRTIFTLDGWLMALDNVSMVATFRHPLAVARSLEKRNGIKIEAGLAIWMAYNERLYTLFKQHRFPVISFDEDMATQRDTLVKVASGLKLPFPEKAGTFFEDNLRHFSAKNIDPLPEQINTLYGKLKQASLR